MRHALHTEVTIDAPPQAVWNVLTDLSRYAEWNPFIVSAAGTVEVGQRLTNRMQPPGGRAMTFKPTVTELDTERSFEWLGRLGLPGLFAGRHRFDLSPNPAGGTHVVHSEQFSGVLVPLLRKSLDTQTKHGFELMNSALKTQAEASSVSRS